MHAELASALSQHDAATERWLDEIRQLVPTQANWRSAPEAWSIAQCLEHVTTVSAQVLPAIAAASADARARGLTSPGPFRYDPVARWFLASQSPTAARRMRAPAVYRPSASELEIGRLEERFLEVQDGLRAAIVAADGLDLARVRAPSPALRLLRLPLGIWLQALPAHTLRHLEQARRVSEDARFPTGD
jgi:hypothetical protein